MVMYTTSKATDQLTVRNKGTQTQPEILSQPTSLKRLVRTASCTGTEMWFHFAFINNKEICFQQLNDLSSSSLYSW